MGMGMELRQVRYFVAVAEELHFGRAAQRLHIVQPTVSQQIQRLERELGLELFDRSTRMVTLTVGGSAFLPHARAILAAEQAARQAMAELRAEQAARLRVGTNVGLGVRLDRILTAMAGRAPRTTVDLVSLPPAARLAQVRTGELDAAFVRGISRSPGLHLIPIWDDPLVAVLPAGHPLAARSRVDLAELAGLPLRIAPREANPELVDLVVRACQDAGFEPIMGPAFTTDQDTLAAIGTGKPSWTVFYAAQAEITPAIRIVFRPFTDPVPVMPTLLAVRPNTPAHRLADLIGACQEQ